MHLVEVIAHLFHPRRSNNHRPRILHPDNILSFAFILVGFGLALGSIPKISPDLGSILGYASDISVEQVITGTNTEREKLGLSQLQYNEVLSRAAAAKAQDMFTQQYWAHVSPSGKEPWDFMQEAEYEFVSAGENLARDFATTPEVIVAWMNSPSHRANIINPKYQEIGVAVVNGKLQGMETTLVVQMFGRPVVALGDDTVRRSAPAVSQEAASTGSVEGATEEVVETAAPVDLALPAQFGIESVTAVISPQQLLKLAFLSVLGLILATLAYDAYISERRSTVRVVGKNFGHIIFFATILLIIIFFKAGEVTAMGAAQ